MLTSKQMRLQLKCGCVALDKQGNDYCKEMSTGAKTKLLTEMSSITGGGGS